MLRDSILNDGVTVPMSSILDRQKKDSMPMRNVAWCLANFLKGKEPPQK